MDISWVIGVLFCIVLIAFLGKHASAAYPIGCGIIIIVFIVLFIKTCIDMQREEKENIEWSEYRRERLRKEMEDIRYKRNPEYKQQEYLKKRGLTDDKKDE